MELGMQEISFKVDLKCTQVWRGTWLKYGACTVQKLTTQSFEICEVLKTMTKPDSRTAVHLGRRASMKSITANIHAYLIKFPGDVWRLINTRFWLFCWSPPKLGSSLKGVTKSVNSTSNDRRVGMWKRSLGPKTRYEAISLCIFPDQLEMWYCTPTTNDRIGSM
jgi:hypothetical protein